MILWAKRQKRLKALAPNFINVSYGKLAGAVFNMKSKLLANFFIALSSV
jgi:hypothetical protein